MIIPLKQLIKDYRLRITGVIHIGAHYGEELQTYKRERIRHLAFIEPCKEAFTILQRNTRGVICQLHNYALGAQFGEGVMNTASHNKGQSNSLLKPETHLKQHPEVVFDGNETVKIVTLDSLMFGSQFNMINMDVQGYELEVLKGGVTTLTNVDVIYTEVNREEVYSGCAKIEQLDEYLKEFTRVKTEWCGGWGDAVYIRKTKLTTNG
jgi:FkbM family methyltransferase